LFVLGLAAEPKLAAFGLAEAGLALLGLQLAQYCGIQRGRWRLAARRSPVALGGHGGDHLLAVHGLARFAERARGGVQGAGLLGLGLLGFGLLGLGRFLGLGRLGLPRRSALLCERARGRGHTVGLGRRLVAAEPALGGLVVGGHVWSPKMVVKLRTALRDAIQGQDRYLTAADTSRQFPEKDGTFFPSPPLAVHAPRISDSRRETP